MDELYEDLKSDLIRFAYSIADQKQEGDDLVQDALEKAFYQKELLSWPRYKQKAWFYRVMKNQLIDSKRKSKREVELDEFYEQNWVMPPVTSIEMVEMLKRLPKIQSDIVFKRYWIGLNSKEIASKIGISASTVRYHLSLAIQTLRDYFEEEL
ncbi:RNA polymerase [Alkalihalobacillus trypoxylicola]|uniref:RNA polymerase n=1 Tax=Alkalihalobacillus trypoxylicola TaxID=519424 RepID=A0A162DPN9_9BACI|nr:RNA polymerase [Alkalihalobacillus trypoxylicola]